MENDIQRDLGRMEAEISSIKQSVSEIREDLREIKRDFDTIKGGTRVFIGIASILGAGLMATTQWVVQKIWH